MALPEKNARLQDLLNELNDVLDASIISNSARCGQSSSAQLQGLVAAAARLVQQCQVNKARETKEETRTCGDLEPVAAVASNLQSVSCQHLPTSADHSIQQQQHPPDIQHELQPIQQGKQNNTVRHEHPSTPDRPKPLVQLDMPHGEVLAGQQASPQPQQHTCCVSICQQQSVAIPAPTSSVSQEKQQQHAYHHACCEGSSQHQPVVPPLMLATKLFKPSISDVLMQMRAANQVQGRHSLAGSGGDAPAPHGTQPAAQAANAYTAATVECPDSPVVASVHLVHNRDGLMQLQQKQEPGMERTKNAAYNAEHIGFDFAGCKDINLLAARANSIGHSTHSSSNNLQKLGAPDQACLYIAKSIGLFIKAVLWDVLLPTSSLIIGWNMLMMTLILYLAVVLPYAVAFALDFSDLKYPLAAFDLCINLFFMLDVWMNFHMAIVGDDGRLILDRREIAVAYVKGWCIVDVLSSIPYEQIININNSLPSMLMLIKVPSVGRISKALKLLRLLRLANVKWLPHVMLSLEALLGRVVLQLVTLAGSMLLLLHWAACIWYFIADIGSATENWLNSNHMQDSSNVEKYVTALYWSVTTIATVGYGDIVGHNITEKIIAMIAMLIGASVFGYFMGAMTVMVSALNANSARMATKRQSVDSFLKHRKVPKLLADKVRSYYNYVVEREVQADEADIIIGLSASLRTQMVLHLYQEALEKVPFFRGQHPQFITSVVTFLKLEYYSPGDIVVRQGDVGAEMYFIGEGLLEVRLYEDDEGSPLTKATYKRTATKDPHKVSRCCTPAPDNEYGRTCTQAVGCNLDSERTEKQCSFVSAAGNMLQKCSAAVHMAAAAIRRSIADSTFGANERQHSTGSADSRMQMARGNQGSKDAAAATAVAVQHSPEGSHHYSAATLPDEWQLPFCSKVSTDKYTYVDELGDRTYRTIGMLRPGEYFGEFSCLLGEARTATVVASSHCELYSLSRGDLEEVLQQWPELAEEFEAMVQIAADRRMAQSPTLGQPSGPLTKWNVFKAAYQQGMFENSTREMKSHQQQHDTGTAPAANDAATGHAVPAEPRRGSFEAPSRALQLLRRLSSTPRSLHELGALAESHPSLGRTIVERTRPCAVSPLTSLTAAVDDGSGASCRPSMFLSQQGQAQQQQIRRQQQQQQQEQSSGLYWTAAATAVASAHNPTTATAEGNRELGDLGAVNSLSCRGDRLSSGSTVLPAGPLGRQRHGGGSLSRQSMPCPALTRTSSGLARSSQGLLRNTPSFTRRGSTSGGGVAPELRRASWMPPGQGTRGGGGGYLFAMPIDRHGSLMVPAIDAFAVAEDPQEDHDLPPCRTASSIHRSS